jgi:hypothetical protein
MLALTSSLKSDMATNPQVAAVHPYPDKNGRMDSHERR